MKANDMGRSVLITFGVLICIAACLAGSFSTSEAPGRAERCIVTPPQGGLSVAPSACPEEVSISGEGDLTFAESEDNPAEEAESAKLAEPDPYELQRMFVDILHQIERNYVTKVDRRRLIEAAIRGMISELDPHSSYLPPERVGDFREAVESQFGGIGLQVGIENGRPRVISPLLDTPAYRAGISAGDWILEIDGKNTEGMSLDDIVHRLKGPPGTSVRLKIRHNFGGHVEDLVLTRELIRVPTVIGFQRGSDDRWEYFLDRDEGLAYVRITTFGRPTADELRSVLEELLAQGMKALVLDLRFNPGGLLSTAVATADLFLREGVIVSVRGRNTADQVWAAHSEGTLPDFPLAVLVNRYSASGSEIVAASLQDHGRAVIVGERSWGKGSVQNLIPLQAAGSALKLTTASYLRPSGKPIHRFPNSREEDDWGVRPDPGFEVRLTPQQMAALMAEQRRREIIPPKPPALAEAGRAPEVNSPETPAYSPEAPSPESQEGGQQFQPEGEGGARHGESPTPRGSHPSGTEKPQGNSRFQDQDSVVPPPEATPDKSEPTNLPQPGSTQEQPGLWEGTEERDPSRVPAGPKENSVTPPEKREVPIPSGPSNSEPGSPAETGIRPHGPQSSGGQSEPPWSFDPQLAKAVEYLREKLGYSPAPGPIASAGQE